MEAQLTLILNSDSIMVTYIETRQISSSIYLILEHDRAGQGGRTERLMRVDEFHNAQCDALRVAVT